MNVNGISSTDQISQVNALSSGNTNSTNRQSSMPPPGIGEAAVPNMSGPSKLMSKLSQLKAADPAQFQSVVSDMAQKLKDAASQTSGPQASFLNNLSSKLSDIANGGDISELKPQGGAAAGAQGAQGAQGAHHGHHHHHAGGAGASSSSGQDSMRSTLDSVFGELDAALSGTSQTTSSSAT